MTCEMADHYWKWLMEKLGWSSPLQSSLVVVFDSWPKLYSNAFFGIIWEVAPPILVWNLWWERNIRIF